MDGVNGWCEEVDCLFVVLELSRGSWTESGSSRCTRGLKVALIVGFSFLLCCADTYVV